MRGWTALRKATAVTGAGSGIGRSLCKALARGGARSVLAIDRDLSAAQATVDQLISTQQHKGQQLQHCEFRAVECDVTDDSALRALLSDSAPLDLFTANAGVATTGGCHDTSPADWQHAWQLNVMHIATAAGILIPPMRARGGGAILITASAAGLLTQLGSAPYTVSKHAAVGLAEWLAITHGGGVDGVTVTCVCPQGVRTPMIEDMLDGPARALALDGLIEPDDVAVEALQCLEAGTFLCMPGGKKGPAKHVARKAADRERWIEGMQRLQAKLSKAV